MLRLLLSTHRSNSSLSKHWRLLRTSISKTVSLRKIFKRKLPQSLNWGKRSKQLSYKIIWMSSSWSMPTRLSKRWWQLSRKTSTNSMPLLLESTRQMRQRSMTNHPWTKRLINLILSSTNKFQRPLWTSWRPKLACTKSITPNCPRNSKTPRTRARTRGKFKSKS